MINMTEIPGYEWKNTRSRGGRSGEPGTGGSYQNTTSAPQPTTGWPGYGGEGINANIAFPANWTAATDYLKGILSGQYGGGGGSDAWSMAKARAQQMLSTGEPTQFQLPEYYGSALDYYKNMMGGKYPGADALSSAEERARQMLATGEPVDIAGWWEAQKPLYQQQYEDQMRQMAEEAGLGGTRWSSVLQRNIADMIRRGETQLTAEAMTRQLAAQEEARQRILQAMGMLSQIGGQQAQVGLTGAQALTSAGQFEAQQRLAAEEAAKQRILESMGILSQIGAGESQAGQAAAARNLAAVQALLGAGQFETEFPLRLASQLAGMGQGLYGMEQTQYENLYNPPWMQAGLSFSGQATRGLPQTYQPSFWEQLAGAASYIPDIVSALSKRPATGGAGSSYTEAGGSYNPSLSFSTYTPSLSFGYPYNVGPY